MSWCSPSRRRGSELSLAVLGWYDVRAVVVGMLIGGKVGGLRRTRRSCERCVYATYLYFKHRGSNQRVIGIIYRKHKYPAGAEKDQEMASFLQNARGLVVVGIRFTPGEGWFRHSMTASHGITVLRSCPHAEQGRRGLSERDREAQSTRAFESRP